MLDEVKKALDTPGKYLVAYADAAVYVALGEDFGLAAGTDMEGKMITALRQIGFSQVFDGGLAVDIYIMEETANLIERIYKYWGIPGYEEAGPLPLISSACPAWVKYAEDRYGQIRSHMSEIKSPQQIMGTLVKTYGAQQLRKNPADLYVVAITPCTASRYECERPEHIASGYKDVDAVLTTRDLALLIKEKQIDFHPLGEGHYDNLVGPSTGAGAIYRASGGVIEGVARTLYEQLSEQPAERVGLEEIRGTNIARSATIDIPVKALDRSLPVSFFATT